MCFAFDRKKEGAINDKFAAVKVPHHREEEQDEEVQDSVTQKMPVSSNVSTVLGLNYMLRASDP